MKEMTCRELGGVCDTKFQAETADEMMQKSMEHGKAMKDELGHKKVMRKMMEMKGAEAEEKFMEDFQKNFEQAPEV